MLSKKLVVIAGGGHAGIEAALAVSRMGGKAMLVTIDTKAIGRMSCNPAIGGLAKGHLVKEIDVFGGVMGFFADMSCIQFKTLNKSKGRAVWSPRAQVDKIKYAAHVSDFVRSQRNIIIKQGEIVGFKTKHGKISFAVLSTGEKIYCEALIITSGTFLNGLIHIGKETFKAGRFGEKASSGLTECLQNYGLKTGRLKTGTPPRLLASSIDWTKTENASGENNPFPFSIHTKRPFKPKNLNCKIVYTDLDTHNTIREKINESSMFSGQIKGVGPRYCPSIEDKIFRFKEKPFHQLFIEPEWENSKQIYLNGFSTSLPKKVQIKSLKTIPAFRNIELIRPGYAIEYDYLIPSQLKRSLESKEIKGLFSAGQINGTSGYEEAAAQGLIAGINAVNYIKKIKPLVLTREEAYIGVLIDDLTTKDINEPYRMFTASAEYRLLLRPDTAQQRLNKAAITSGTLSKKQQKTAVKYLREINSNIVELKKDRLSKNSHYNKILRNETSYLEIYKEKVFNKKSLEALFAAETLIKYEGYIKREKERLIKTKLMEKKEFEQNFNFMLIPNLSNEAREKLQRLKPETLGQASRIAGVKPSDIASLAIALSK
ncbi:MAG: tRNA uridine-5-carboxymethylaminomethyl(34) synthesis enzyme MnmG [Candidatus Marinimicrobia bacterium]|nr:tRNA uridine-5-carboxymethylaminomethyl(34) synthesis enzyme MnmG [Candidatus Neomarinimicrobiota bacterium]